MSPSCREEVGAGNKTEQDGRKCPHTAAGKQERGTKRSKMEENVPTLPPGSKRGEQKEARWKKMSPSCRKGTGAGNKTEQDWRNCPRPVTRKQQQSITSNIKEENEKTGKHNETIHIV